MQGVYNVRTILLLAETAGSTRLLTKDFIVYDAEIIDVHLLFTRVLSVSSIGFLIKIVCALLLFSDCTYCSLYLHLNRLSYLLLLLWWLTFSCGYACVRATIKRLLLNAILVFVLPRRHNRRYWSMHDILLHGFQHLLHRSVSQLITSNMLNEMTFPRQFFSPHPTPHPKRANLKCGCMQYPTLV
jgi:hypothetical protein